MRTAAMRPAPACQLCEFISLRPARRLRSPLGLLTASRRYAQKSTRPAPTAPAPRRKAPPAKRDIPSRPIPQDNQLADVKGVVALRDAILSSESVSEDEVLQALTRCEEVATTLSSKPKATAESELEESAASHLLSLEQDVQPTPKSPTVEVSKNMMSETAYSIVKHPPVLITPKILQVYVQIQAALGRPETIPEAFTMFASKPRPSGSTYKTPYPDLPSAAIPVEVADVALQSAIESRQLGTAAELINTSYGTKAFQRQKFVSKAMLPTITAAAMPAVAYGLALKYAEWQVSNSPEVATSIGFTAFLAYFSFTGIVGYVAMTTANDQMHRVTWADGMPLHERWLREDERAAVDKIACAWGFQDKFKWGNEEGDEWETLREWIGIKGMWLDRISLMDLQ